MNAFLRLRFFLEKHCHEFPRHEKLREHLAQKAETLKVAMAEADVAEDIAPGFREGAVFLERFNLRTADLALFLDDLGAPGIPHQLRTDFEETGSVYLRNTFAPRRFYHAPTLGDGSAWVFVLENKVLAGR